MISKAFVAALALFVCASAHSQQEKPGAVLAQGADTVVQIRAVDHEARTVTVATPAGRLLKFNVPPQAQNLDQVYAGSRFRVAYLESVALFISPVGGTPAVGEATAVKMADKGDTPGGTIVEVKQVQALVESIDYGSRRVVLTGPEGHHIEVTVDEAVQRLDEIEVGDLVVLRYTEALAMRMIRE